MSAARLGGFDVLILDTAGRTTLDEAMMSEAAEIARIAAPTETLLVADSLTGQDAVRTAKAFHERLPLTGLVLTRADGDARGGAALSMRAVTGLPIKFLGTGEKIDALDVFDAQRVAGRILGRGDVVALVERAAAELDEAKARTMAEKLAKGRFDLDDMADQLAQMERMGGMEGLVGMLPGVQKMKKQIAESGMTDATFRRQRAIIGSMTRQERKKPDMLQASRKRRIAAGAGVEVAEVNRLLKQHRQMQDAFKMMAKGGGRGFAKLGAMMGGLPGGLPGAGECPPAAASIVSSRSAAAPCRAAIRSRAAACPVSAARRQASTRSRNPDPSTLKPPKVHSLQCSRFVSPAAAPRSARIIPSSSPTAIRRATAGSSKRSAAYNPLLKKDDAMRVVLKGERITEWLGKGAQPSERVARLLAAQGLTHWEAGANPKKGEPHAKAKERATERAERAAALAEALANAPPPEEPAPEPEVEPEVESRGRA